MKLQINLQRIHIFTDTDVYKFYMDPKWKKIYAQIALE